MSIKLVAKPADYFRELVTSALQHQRLRTLPETEFYLVNLLLHFMSTDNLYTRDAEGHFREEPLALMLKEALEQTEPRQQELMFRHVGDVSLYVAGYFQDSLFRKLVDLDYYVSLGGGAYNQVANRVQEAPLKPTFEELSDKFPKLVAVLAEVGEKTQAPRTEKDLIRTYDLWRATQDERARRKLTEAGIVLDPAAAPKKKLSS